MCLFSGETLNHVEEGLSFAICQRLKMIVLPTEVSSGFGEWREKVFFSF